MTAQLASEPQHQDGFLSWLLSAVVMLGLAPGHDPLKDPL